MKSIAEGYYLLGHCTLLQKRRSMFRRLVLSYLILYYPCAVLDVINL